MIYIICIVEGRCPGDTDFIIYNAYKEEIMKSRKRRSFTHAFVCIWNQRRMLAWLKRSFSNEISSSLLQMTGNLWWFNGMGIWCYQWTWGIMHASKELPFHFTDTYVLEYQRRKVMLWARFWWLSCHWCAKYHIMDDALFMKMNLCIYWRTTVAGKPQSDGKGNILRKRREEKSFQ